METGESTKKHVRQGSRASLPRRSTKGPLDVSDSPLAADLPAPQPLPHQPHHQATQRQVVSPKMLSASQAQFSSPKASSRSNSPRNPPRMPSPQVSNLSSNQSFQTAHSTLTPQTSGLAQKKDFSYLLRPEIYHPLTLLDVPPPFRVSNTQPDPSTPLSTLLSTGAFRSAAILSASILTSTPAPSPAEIFSLIYTRLSCLTLCNATTLAAQEVKALEDLNASFYHDEETGEHLVPWELRVLAIRLQGLGFSDVRRGIMGFFDLGREARLTLTKLKKERLSSPSTKLDQAIELWEARLAELSLKVVGALIEMEDLEGATRTLKDLELPGKDLAFQKALLWLHLGDVDAARAAISSASGERDAEVLQRETKVIKALAYMCDAEYEKSVPMWKSLVESDKGHADVSLYTQNMAVCLLYLGNLAEARTILTDLTQTGTTPAFHALTFNLCTIYELCTERSRSLKIELAEKVAELRDQGKTDGGLVQGWEKVNGDFKL